MKHKYYWNRIKEMLPEKEFHAFSNDVNIIIKHCNDHLNIEIGDALGEDNPTKGYIVQEDVINDDNMDEWTNPNPEIRGFKLVKKEKEESKMKKK